MSQIPSPFQLLKSNSRRRALILSALLLFGFAMLIRSSASNTNPGDETARTPQLQRGSKRPDGCPSCPPPSARKIYAPAIELREAERCEIVLNSRSANPIEVVPIFYTLTGDAIVGNPVQLQPAEIRFVPVEQLMPEALRGRHRWGGIALSYTGNVLEVWAQITFHGVGGGSVDETFNVLEEPGSDTREAVWWMPKKSTAIIAMGNSSNAGIHATAQFSDGDVEVIDIPAGATKFIRRKARSKDADTESVKLTTVGPEGSMRVMGFMVADDGGFTSSIRFHDTKRIVQPNLYATNLKVSEAMLRMVLKNTSSADISARPRFFTAAGAADSPVELPVITLRPQQIVEVDLGTLRTAAASRTDLDSVSAEIVNDGAPGSLIGAAYSTDAGSRMTYDVPLRDSGKVRNLTGSYPWRIDDDYSTVVSVTNVGDRAARFQVEIRYPGGPYSIRPRQLEPGQTAEFDLRQMRDEQIPDRTGKLLTVERGQFHWSVVATPGEARLVGRAQVVSRTARVASSYSCPTCCPDSGPYGGFNPSGYTLYIDGFAATGSNGVYHDCYWNSYPTTIWWTSLSTWDPSVATFVSGTEDLHGEGAGFTYGTGEFDRTEWWTDNMDCYQYYWPTADNAAVEVARELHFTQVRRADVSASFDWGPFTDEANFNLGAAADASALCNGQSFTVTIDFTFPPGGNPYGRNDPRNKILTGSNHQYEWQDWNFTNIDSAAGSGSMFLRLFRRAINPNFADYVDMTISGANPPGTIGSFAGKGRIHFLCP